MQPERECHWILVKLGRTRIGERHVILQSTLYFLNHTKRHLSLHEWRPLKVSQTAECASLTIWISLSLLWGCSVSQMCCKIVNCFRQFFETIYFALMAQMKEVGGEAGNGETVQDASKWWSSEFRHKSVKLTANNWYTYFFGWDGMGWYNGLGI